MFNVTPVALQCPPRVRRPQDMLLARSNLRSNKMVMREIDRWWHVFADDKEVSLGLGMV